MEPIFQSFQPILPEPKPEMVIPFKWDPQVLSLYGMTIPKRRKEVKTSRTDTSSLDYFCIHIMWKEQQLAAAFNQGAFDLVFGVGGWYPDDVGQDGNPYIRTTIITPTDPSALLYFHDALLLGRKKDGWMIDHIDTCRRNNTFENLRLVTPRFNAVNKEHGATHWSVSSGYNSTYVFNVRLFGKTYCLPALTFKNWSGFLSNLIYFSLFGMAPGFDGMRGNLVELADLQKSNLVRVLLEASSRKRNKVSAHLLAGVIEQIQHPFKVNAGRDEYERAVELAYLQSSRPSDFETAEELASELVRAEAALAVA